ncbi:MAG: T6SS immunity protein Tdi1 domain-containing protein [Planctomycetota bacterium]
MNPLLDVISEAWGWLNINPIRIEDENEFGCVVFLDEDGSRWLIRTDEPSCEVIARNDYEYEELIASDDYLFEWNMSRLVETAKQHLGKKKANQCYCLKIPSVFGGEYAAENFGIITREGLISFAGDLARQIRANPDGSSIMLNWPE